MNWHQLAISNVFALTGSSSAGLATTAAQEKRQQFGYNELPGTKKQLLWLVFLPGFKDIMILVLIVAAMIAGITVELTDMIAILSIIFLNSLTGFAQQYKTGRFFGTQPLTFKGLIVCLGIAAVSINSNELGKWVKRRLSKTPGDQDNILCNATVLCVQMKFSAPALRTKYK